MGPVVPMQMPMQPMHKPGMGTGAQPDGSWTCKDCQNVNWPLRTVCNNKKCNALGPWTCGSCGNKNFQGRDVCNRRTCGLPRPEGRDATPVGPTNGGGAYVSGKGGFVAWNAPV